MQAMQDYVTPHAARLAALWEKMVRAIGIHTVNVLLERAIWETSQAHPELTLIERTDEGLSFDALAQAYAGRPAEEISAAFGDLDTDLMLILARLLGKEMAQRLAEELQTSAATAE